MTTVLPALPDEVMALIGDAVEAVKVEAAALTRDAMRRKAERAGKVVTRANGGNNGNDFGRGFRAIMQEAYGVVPDVTSDRDTEGIVDEAVSQVPVPPPCPCEACRRDREAVAAAAVASDPDDDESEERLCECDGCTDDTCQGDCEHCSDSDCEQCHGDHDNALDCETCHYLRSCCGYCERCDTHHDDAETDDDYYCEHCDHCSDCDHKCYRN